MIKIKRGLTLPINGKPSDTIVEGKPVSEVAVVGLDYVGMKPTLEVEEGDVVKKGQLLFSDKKTQGVNYTAPASGKVKAIHRGERRRFLSLVIQCEGDEAEQFQSFKPNELAQIGAQTITDILVKSGQWNAFLTRPFSKIPAPDSSNQAIFVNAMDTNPLAADPAVIINKFKEDFCAGLVILKQLTSGKLYVCHKPDSNIPNGSVAQNETFDGPHPAGLTGTHIHYLHPVSQNRVVWSIGYQDVIAIGKLFTTGELYTDRIIALGGPQVKNPQLIKTQLGANLHQVTHDLLKDGNNRIISGSVFGGRGIEEEGHYLGRYHNQVSVLSEGDHRLLLHYLHAGRNRFSVMPIFISKLLKKNFDFNTSTNGSERTLFPIGAYEKVMPLDILPTQLLRALAVQDMEEAIALGALELAEEDLALCTFVSPGKYEYGPILRKNLTKIELEG